MSYATGTTHYNLPQTAGTDKRDWSDTNQAFADIDAAIYQASGDATTALSTATSAASTATSAASDAASAVTTANSASATATSASETATLARTEAQGATTTANAASATASAAQTTASNADTVALAAQTAVTALAGRVDPVIMTITTSTRATDIRTAIETALAAGRVPSIIADRGDGFVNALRFVTSLATGIRFANIEGDASAAMTTYCRAIVITDTSFVYNGYNYKTNVTEDMLNGYTFTFTLVA